MVGNGTLAAAAKSGGFNPSTLILILIVVVAFYFLMIRPQQRRKQAAAKQTNTLAPGATVRTTAGMYATVVEVDGDDVVLEVAPGVEVRYMRRAVMEVITPGDPVEEDVVTDEADEDDETATGYYGEEPADTVVDAAAPETTAPEAVVDGDADEAAYEQATGTKKD
jgi:preprotein translocase subunit YajC